jgi:hypothetical protein
MGKNNKLERKEHEIIIISRMWMIMIIMFKRRNHLVNKLKLKK